MNQEDDAANEAVMVKGSGRSIEAYSMYEELNKCSDLLVKFGGHPMAAGLSLKEEDVDELRRRLNENTTLSDEDLVEKVYLDARMPLSYLNQRLVEELDRLDPFGNQNEKPVFGASDIPVVSARTIGKDGQYLKFTLRTENGGTIDALMFRGCEDFKDSFYDKFGESKYRDMFSRRGADVKLTFTFYPNLNTFRDETKVQVMISDVIL
jgi:single-stranded-DNA-specific exonuclease